MDSRQAVFKMTVERGRIKMLMRPLLVRIYAQLRTQNHTFKGKETTL